MYLNQLIQFYLNNTLNLRSSTPHVYYTVLYPQNGDRIVTIDYVTSLHAMYYICDWSGSVPGLTC